MTMKMGTVRFLTDKSALERWLPPFGYTGTNHEIDLRVGGGYQMSFINFGTGIHHSFSVKYLELIMNECIIINKQVPCT